MQHCLTMQVNQCSENSSPMATIPDAIRLARKRHKIHTLPLLLACVRGASKETYNYNVQCKYPGEKKNKLEHTLFVLLLSDRSANRFWQGRTTFGGQI